MKISPFMKENGHFCTFVFLSSVYYIICDIFNTLIYVAYSLNTLVVKIIVTGHCNDPTPGRAK